MSNLNVSNLNSSEIVRNDIANRRVTSIPSQVVSVFSDNNVVHLTIDSGATVSFITKQEALRLKFRILPASQLANQADGKTKILVLGEVHESFTRGSIKFKFDALVVKHLNEATILAGMNFLYDNKITQEPHKHRVTVDGKYSIEETLSEFIYKTGIPISKAVPISRIKTLMGGDNVQTT